MGGILSQWSGTTIVSFGMVLLALGPIMALELAFPRSRVPMRARLKGLAFQALSLPVFALMPILLDHVLSPSPLAVINYNGLPFKPVLGLLLALIMGDFWFYWMHRIEHRFLWRFHAVHHAIENVSAATSYHHLSEAVFQAFFMSLPSALFVQHLDVNPYLFGTLAWAQGYYLHSSTRIHLGPLRYIVGDNLFHRIHHSTNPAHFDKNFSAVAPIWDLVFGTAYFPKPHEWPDSGLTDRSEVSGLWEWIVRPFRA
jgi:sterol desaturase/sphingolipid hydroxylase (fatty acid hydroxylase superfamily)